MEANQPLASSVALVISAYLAAFSLGHLMSASRVPATLHSSHSRLTASAPSCLTQPSFSFYSCCELLTNSAVLHSITKRGSHNKTLRARLPQGLLAVWRPAARGPTARPEQSAMARVAGPCGQPSFGGSPGKAGRHSDGFLSKVPSLPVFLLPLACQLL